MDDLISRQAAIEHLKKRLYETEFNSTAEYPYYQEIADNRVDIWMNEVPSAQPERKTGRWLPDNRPGGGFWVCSYCKFPSEAFAADKLYKYCPVCGACMGGEHDGSD